MTMLFFLGVALVICLILIYYLQFKIIYPSFLPPEARTHVEKPHTDYTHITLQPHSIHAYHIHPPSPSAYTFLYLHANAGNMGDRLPLIYKMRELFEHVPHFIMLSYRGYGLSGGSPSEQGLKEDAQNILDYILRDEVLGETKVVVMGTSLGGAVASHLVARNPDKIHALILENTFTSVIDLVPYHFPVLKHVSFLCHQRWMTVEEFPRIHDTIPMLFLASTHDDIVPHSHMKTLYRMATEGKEKEVNKTRRWVELVGAQHNNACMHPAYWQGLVSFWHHLMVNAKSE